MRGFQEYVKQGRAEASFVYNGSFSMYCAISFHLIIF